MQYDTMQLVKKLGSQYLRVGFLLCSTQCAANDTRESFYICACAGSAVVMGAYAMDEYHGLHGIG